MTYWKRPNRQQAVPKEQIFTSTSSCSKFKPSRSSNSKSKNKSSTSATGGKSQRFSHHSTSSNAEIDNQGQQNEPPSATTSEEGWNLLNKMYVDPVCHPDGFPLVHFFYKGAEVKSPYRPCRNFCVQHNMIAWERIFAAQYSCEKILTAKITREMQSTMESEGFKFGISGQTAVGDICSSGNNGRADILISQQSNPVAIFEVGMNNTEWWAKVGQGIKIARIGVFLCWKVEDSVSVSLLWHTETRTCADLAIAFTTTINGVRNLVALHRTKFNDENFAVLGPNCCRFTSTTGELHVFRCYDSRISPTDRCTTIYEKSSVIFTDNIENRQMIRPMYEFTNTGPSNGQHTVSYSSLHIWTNHGSLKIVEIPFFEGIHLPRKVGDFLSIIKELKQMHKNAYVHGDIRLYNIVVTDDGGSLIDFDFGGECNKVTYPKGYKNSLADGSRMGEPGQLIRIGHDWYALANLLFRKLTPKLPSNEKGKSAMTRMSQEDPSFKKHRFLLSSAKTKRIQVEKHESWMNSLLCGKELATIQDSTEFTEDLEKYIDKLQKFLELRKDWKFGMTKDLELCTKNHLCRVASGSPRKDEIC